MIPPDHGSADVLSGEILADARRQAEEILRQARHESESLLAAAQTRADNLRREKLAAARAEAARRCELILATIPVEAGQLRSARIESVLESIREAVRQRLLEGSFDRREAVVSLAAEAIRGMPGADFVLRLSPGDHGGGADALAEAIRRRAGRSPLNLTLRADSTVAGGGVMVQDPDESRIWDNQPTARLNRLWPELRRLIARQTSLIERSGPTESNHA